ncbi:MAG: hypothetical protein H6828_06715 [Planctomycetes bacterium]|nr:hypothetical protein [Planctomycetota bacterium]
MSPLAPAVVLALAVAPVLQSAAAPVSARLEADVRQETPLWVQLQRADGGWSAASVPAGEGVVQGRADDDVLVTGLLTLAMLGDGKTPSAGPCKENVRGALDFLLAAQAEDGRVGTSPSVASQAVAAFALSEAAFLGQDEACANGARRAVRWLEQRALAGGGWAATAGETEVYDARATCWATLALVSARSSALVEAPQLVAAAAWRARTEGDDAAEADTRALSFELVTRLMAGETALAAPELHERAAVLLARPVAWTPSGEGFDAESYYLRSLLAYNLGGEAWKGWHATMKAVLKAGADGGALLAVDPSVPGGSLAALGYGTLALLAAGQKPGRGSASTRCEPQVTLHVLTRQRADGLWSAATLLPSRPRARTPARRATTRSSRRCSRSPCSWRPTRPTRRRMARAASRPSTGSSRGKAPTDGSRQRARRPARRSRDRHARAQRGRGALGDDARLAALEAAVALLRRTALEDGGWPVAPGERDLDARTTCWAAMALRSARDAGLRAPSPRRGRGVRACATAA